MQRTRSVGGRQSAFKQLQTHTTCCPTRHAVGSTTRSTHHDHSTRRRRTPPRRTTSSLNLPICLAEALSVLHRNQGGQTQRAPSPTCSRRCVIPRFHKIMTDTFPAPASGGSEESTLVDLRWYRLRGRHWLHRRQPPRYGPRRHGGQSARRHSRRQGQERRRCLRSTRGSAEG